MAASRISIVRIFLALVFVTAAVALVAATFVAGHQYGMYQARAMEWSRDIRGSAWRLDSDRWAALAAVDRFGVLEQEEGNAFSLYWPAGVEGATPRCPRGFAAPFESTIWSSQARAQEAANCALIDEIVRAARMAYLDMSSWAATGEGGTEEDVGPYFNVGAPLHDVSAVLARAHFRIVEGDLEGGEADARAVVSSGLHFLRGGADPADMTWASALVTAALDHLRVIYEKRGDTASVASIDDAMDVVSDVRRSLMRLENMVVKAAGLGNEMHRVVALAADPSIPFGLRTYSTVMLGYAYIVDPAQALLGPNEKRTDALATLANRPELGGAIERARKGLAMPMRERLSLMNQMALR